MTAGRQDVSEVCGVKRSGFELRRSRVKAGYHDGSLLFRAGFQETNSHMNTEMVYIRQKHC